MIKNFESEGFVRLLRTYRAAFTKWGFSCTLLKWVTKVSSYVCLLTNTIPIRFDKIFGCRIQVIVSQNTAAVQSLC